MSEQDTRKAPPLIDFVAQSLQALNSSQRLRNQQPLVRIDNLKDAAQAPFQLDASTGRLHRRGCRAIPARSRLALYGLWHFGPEEGKLICPSCQPEPMNKSTDSRSDATDILFGLVSLIDQFGGVLRERGQEYRSSEGGRQLGHQFEGLLQRLDQGEQDFLSTLLTSMDGLIKTVRDLEAKNHNGGGTSHGHHQDEGGKTESP
jgi:hypothetical protein